MLSVPHTLLFNKFNNILASCMILYVHVEIKEDIKGIKSDVLEAKMDIESVSKKVSDIEDSMEYHAKTVVENDEKQKSNIDKAEIDTKIQELNKKLILKNMTGSIICCSMAFQEKEMKTF